jgi:hypothetical protein
MQSCSEFLLRNNAGSVLAPLFLGRDQTVVLCRVAAGWDRGGAEGGETAVDLSSAGRPVTGPRGWTSLKHPDDRVHVATRQTGIPSPHGAVLDAEMGAIHR